MNEKASSWVLRAMVLLCFLAAHDGSLADDAAQNRSAQTHPGHNLRQAWTSSKFVGSPEPGPQYLTQRRYEALAFNRPVAITRLPGDNRLVVVENKGQVLSFVDSAGTAAADLMIDLTREIKDYWRTYGIAFHPQFSENRYVFLCYVLQKGLPEGTHVSRFRVTATDPPRIDAASEEVLLTWPSGGHNGGCLKFGPDGCLYISTGDGADPSPPDPLRTGQDVRDLLASILRIDVDHPSGGRLYGVPADNPFIHLDGARPEVWAFGLRNPWKMSFDPVTGDLWVGDVGWELWEMVQRVQRGGNYGWSVKEGRQPVNPEAPVGPSPLLPPIVALPHTVARSITGGITYQGDKLPELKRAYVFGDYVTGKLWQLRWKDDVPVENKELANSSLAVIAFGEDTSGELLVLDYSGGIYELKKSEHAAANKAFPKLLSQSGLFANTPARAPAAGVIPYSIVATPWADGARSGHLIGVPDLKKLGVYQVQNVQAGTIKGEWEFPSGTVLAKTLTLPLVDEEERLQSEKWQPIETQILHRDGETWRAYSYRWNADATDAALVPAGGQDRAYRVFDPSAPDRVRNQTWHFAGRTECLVCHTTRAGSIHGFNRRQLRTSHDYGGKVADQMATLESFGLFEQPVVYDQPPMSSPWDEEASLESRARSYLHVNCAHCHRRGGGGNAPFELLQEVELEKLGILGRRPTQGTFGIHNAAVVASGKPEHSVLLYRLLKLGPGRMPYAGSNRIDVKGARLIHDWIASLPASADTSNQQTAAELRAEAALLSLQDRSTDRRNAQQAISELLSSTAGAMQLLWQVELEKIDDGLRKMAIASASKHEDIRIRELFERYLPEEERVKRLGNTIDPQAILALQGEIDRGRKVFFSTSGVQCKACHKIGPEGGAVGPDLSLIGKKLDRQKMLEAIVEPSKDIDPKFITYLVETGDGRVVRGLLSSRSEDGITLIDPQGKLVEIAADNIEFMATQQKSLMPDLMLRDMSAQQVADLLAFLSSLR